MFKLLQQYVDHEQEARVPSLPFFYYTSRVNIYELQESTALGRGTLGRTRS